MIKVTLFLFLVLTFFTCNEKETSYKLWYVSNTQFGNGDGTSWANARNMKDFTSAWYGSRVQPGDTVFIDGGTSGKTYTWASSGNGEAYATFLWNKSGTADDKIVITRGKDEGHNGTPTIETGYTAGIYANAVQYVEFSYLKLKSVNLYGSKYMYNAGFRNQGCDNIDILHNEFDYSQARAIMGGGSAANYTSNVRIMHNNIYTDTVTVGVNYDYQNDAIKVDWASNLEIAYNVIINKAPMYGLDGSGAHRDFFQITGGGYDGSTVKIHHNFVGSILGESADIGTDEMSAIDIQGVYAEPWGGRWYIYNNIFTFYHNKGDIINLGDLDSTRTAGFRSLYMFNNTIVHTITHNYQGQVFVQSPDTLMYKNNLYYSEQGDIFGGFTMSALDYYDIDYNQYTVPSTSSFEGGLSFANWKSTYRVDAHSEAYTSGSPDRFVLVDSLSENPLDYILATSSTGIDEGTNLSSYFTTDYRDTSRVGKIWDVGAFENSK